MQRHWSSFFGRAMTISDEHREGLPVCIGTVGAAGKRRRKAREEKAGEREDRGEGKRRGEFKISLSLSSRSPSSPRSTATQCTAGAQEEKCSGRDKRPEID